MEIIDFRQTPNWTSINQSFAKRPYFLDFMSTMHRQTQPHMTDPPVWLWICGSKEAEVQVSHYAHNALYRDMYEHAYSSYLPTMNKRLEDRQANNKLVRAKMHLIFLVKKIFKLDGKPIKIPSAFEALNTFVYQKPRKYNELEYRNMISELFMEFYLRVMEIFCQPTWGRNSLNFWWWKSGLCRCGKCFFRLSIMSIKLFINCYILFRSSQVKL